MKRFFSMFSGIIFLILAPGPKLYAWGHPGHRIVAGIAMQYLTPQVKSSVERILSGMTAESAATWMDDVKRDTAYKYTLGWHYINYPEGTEYQAPTEENIIQLLSSAFIGLKHRDKIPVDQQKFCLLMLFHLVGDLHQPLHTGYAKDTGGNDVKLHFLKDSTDLHHVWDDYIIKQEQITLESVEKQKNNFDATTLSELGKVDFVGWMKGSRSLLQGVYDYKGNYLDGNYSSKHKDEVEKQLFYAGYRLAAVLNAAFGA